MANLKTLTIDGTSMDNFHPATVTLSSKTFNLTSGSVQLWDTGITIPKGICFIGAYLTFPASSAGSRYFQLGTYDGSTFSNNSNVRVPACPSGDTILFAYTTCNSGGTETLACRLFQNSGSTQTVTLTYRLRSFPTLLGG